MPAISCPSCRSLISDDEKTCPYCKASIQVEIKSRKVSKSWFADPLTIVNWLVWTNVALYITSFVLDMDAAIQNTSSLWGLGAPTRKALLALGMTGGFTTSCGHWWTLLTASFLHGSLLHIYFNMSWLKQLGQMMALLLGPGRLILAYILTGIGGFLLSNLWHNTYTIGASCSIFGLMGVLIVFGNRRGGIMGNNLTKQLWIWAGIGLLFGEMIPNINNAGHIGGFITGLILGFLFPKHEHNKESGTLQLIALLVLGMTLLAFLWNGYLIQDMLKLADQTGQAFCPTLPF